MSSNQISFQVPSCKVLKDLSHKGSKKHDRKVYKVEYTPTGGIFKCYAIHLPAESIRNQDLAKKLKLAQHRWLKVNDYGFPQWSVFIWSTQYHQQTAEVDVLCLLHAYTLIEHNPLLKQYVEAFDEFRIFISSTHVYFLQPWVEAVKLPNPEGMSVDEIYAVVNEYLGMFQVLHEHGICFYDTTFGTYSSRGFSGNIFLKKDSSTDSGYKVVWLDVESLCRFKKGSIGGIDKDKVAYLIPPFYKEPLDNMFIESVVPKPFHDKNGKRLFSWSVDILIFLRTLIASLYLKRVEAEIFLSHLQLKNGTSISTFDGPFTFRMSPDMKMYIPSPESTGKGQHSEKVPTVATSVSSSTNPTQVTQGDEQKGDAFDKKLFIKSSLIVALIAVIIAISIWLFNTVSCDSVRTSELLSLVSVPFVLSTNTNDEFLQELDKVQQSLAEKEKSSERIALEYFLLTQDSKDATVGTFSCPIRDEKKYAKPRTFHSAYKTGHCEQFWTEVSDFESIMPSSPVIQFTARYFDMAKCISHIGSVPRGSSFTDDVKVSFCQDTLWKTHALIVSSNLPKWSEVELSLLWMAIVNTKSVLIKDDVSLLDDICINLVDTYDRNQFPGSVYTVDAELALNRCLINAGPAQADGDNPLLDADRLMVFALGFSSQGKWTNQEWYGKLTWNRAHARAKTHTFKLQETWEAHDIDSYYSWLAKSLSSGVVQPLPGQFEQTGWCVPLSVIPIDLNMCSVLEDKFGWVEMMNAMENAGLKRS